MVGVFVDSRKPPDDPVDLVSLGTQVCSTARFHFISQDGGSANKSGADGDARRSLRRLAARFFTISSLKFIQGIERSFLDRFVARDDATGERRVARDAIHIAAPRLSEDGKLHYSPHDLEKIGDLNLDVIVNYHSLLIGAELFALTKNGVLAFQWGLAGFNSEYAAFPETVEKRSFTKLAITQFVDDGKNFNTLIEGRISTKFPYSRNKDAIFRNRPYYLCVVLDRMAKNGVSTSIVGSGECVEADSGRHYWLNVVKYVASILKFAVRKKFICLLGAPRRRWNIAFMPGSWETLADGVTARGAKRIANVENHFLADPFVITENSRNVCYAENYDNAKGNGCIVAYELGENEATLLGDVLHEPFHLSFPYVFRFDGKIYMCPECSEVRQIRLYECVEFPLKWKMSHVLLDNLSAADTMIFEHEGRWWMFTNIDTVGLGDHCDKLYIYYADTPLAADWRPHAKNPISLDASSARNGGLLFDAAGVPHRVAQRQEFRVYGKAFTVRKIVELSPTEFRESEVLSSDAVFGQEVEASHHLHCNGQMMVFDLFA